MTALVVGVKSVGLAAQGLPSWAESQAVLKGQAAYLSEELPRYAPNLLPPNERRRATAVGRLAFQSAEEAIGGINGNASHLASVFASSGGDTDIVTKICTALATEERLVSPTHFHNSVHNAAAGYWSIATHSHGVSTSLSAFDGSFAMGLLEAATLARCECQDVLLVSYDVPVPPPLDTKRPVHRPFTTALILSADGTGQAQLRINVAHEGMETTLEDPELEILRLNNPAARALPLLCGLAVNQPAHVTLPGVDGLVVDLEIEPAG